MAPPRRYPSPHEQLVALLADARRQGLRFEEAWTLAIRPGRATVMTNAIDPPAGAVLWPTDSRDRNAWKAAIVSSKDGFRRAYELRPQTPRERSVGVLISLLLREPADLPPAVAA